MSKELFVSSTPHETKVAIVEDDQLTEVYFERENEYTLAGSVYKGRVTRVLPGMQSAFVNIGLDRDAFLYVSDFLLQEDDDVDDLDQAVARSPIEILEPQPANGEPQAPIEAQDVYSAGEALPAQEEPSELETAGEAQPEEEQEREGARRWRGRRRRGKGRDRFQERSERPREESAAPRVSETQPEQRHDSPRHESPRHDFARHEPPAHQGIVLPGESISKYQPQGSAPQQPSAPAPPPPQPRHSKPSTEYALDPSQFSAGSMTLPGESIAKYRHNEGPVAVTTAPEPVEHRVQEAERPHAVVEEQQPAPLAAAAVAEHQSEVAESHAPAEHVVPAVETREVFEAHESRHSAPPVEEQRYEDMNVAAAFGAAVTDPPEIETHDVNLEATSTEEVQEEHSASAPAQPAEGAWNPAVRGVVEEEEIEEEESEMPGFEEHLDLAEYEELEEEELAPDLTEAVRDAHVEGHTTGRYQMEEADGEEGFEAAETAADFQDDGAEAQEEGEEEVESAEESEAEMEGARAEMRAPDATAGYQQRTGRRPADRRNRKVGRRMRGRPPRHHVQRHFPAISDLLKEGQEILVQIAKEPIAKKGARITSHIALPGRYLVYMPTVHHTGVSRKIASEEERHRLKRIVISERGEANGGFIVRTAASGASEEDLRADIRFLINLWIEIRGRAEKAKAPALIYHDLNLVERILRDQVTVTFSSIWVDTEQEYERILRFVSRFQPSLVKRVKLYTKETPLFEQFSISDEINKALKSKVWLKSGGYIVINQTEALVAIDVNTGKYVGKTARLEDTIVKTNIDAIREIVRQIRLRDLGGIIVIDFIDMDERKNRHRVMQALEEALKADRAPSKVLQFNDFGLVAITRKRVKQSLERTLGQQCTTCTGTGMIKSVTTVCNEIYVEMRKMSRHFDHDVMLRVHPEVGKALKANNARWLQEMEELIKQTILVKSDPLLHAEQFDIQ